MPFLEKSPVKCRLSRPVPNLCTLCRMNVPGGGRSARILARSLSLKSPHNSFLKSYVVRGAAQNMSAVPPSPAVAVANKKLVNVMKDNPTGGWDDAWRIGLTPWDSGDVQPALRDLILSSELDLPKSGRALIPGCGTGYDATFIASHLGLDALAIDLSPTAVQAARNHFAKVSAGLPVTKLSFEAADFFNFSVPDDQKFSLVYDHTFFVAIPPTRRGEWGKQISGLLKPGGYLILLIFPLNLPEDDDGPPFYVIPEHYDGVLGEGWEKVLDKIPKHSHPRRVGRERLVVYKKL